VILRQVSVENVEIVRRIFEIGIRDLDAWLELCDPAIEWFPAPQSLLAGRSYRGHEDVRRFWEDLWATWEDYQVEPEEFRDFGDQVVVVNRIRARSARGMEVDEVWSSLFTLREGKIIRFQGFADRSGALEAAAVCDKDPSLGE
jgi:ketosteroid isomerase-like protein